MKTAIVKERFVSWALEPNGVYRFAYKRNEETYTYRCRPGCRRECLRAIALDGSNPELSLDYMDVVEITARVREVVLIVDELAQTITTTVDLKLAEFDDLFSDHDGLGSTTMLGTILIVAAVFWGVILWLAVTAIL